MALNAGGSNLGRRLAVGSNTVLVVLIVAAALAVSYALVARFRYRVDVSADQQATLSPELLGRLRLVEEGGATIQITAFTAQQGRPDAFYKNRALQDMMEELGRASARVEAKLVDFDRDRLTAEQLGVTEYGTIVLQRGEERVDIHDRDLFRSVGKGEDRHVEFLGAPALSRGLAQLVSTTRQVVYTVVGHGEPMPDDKGPSGLSDLGVALAQERYPLQPLDLARAGQGGAPAIPDDAAAVLLLRPTLPIPAQEEDVLLGWVAAGGALLIGVEPGAPPPALLERFGVSVPDGYVLDRVLQFPYPDRPIPSYRSHPIVQELAAQSLAMAMSRVAPLQPVAPAKEGVRVTTLLETTREGWIERGGEEVDGKAAYTPNVDGQGPVASALALELSAASGLVRGGGARAVVVGDIDLFTNAHLTEGAGNLPFTLNALRWLVKDEERLRLVSGRPAAARRLTLTSEDVQRITWISTAVAPLLALAGGVGIWFSRRGR